MLLRFGVIGLRMLAFGASAFCQGYSPDQAAEKMTVPDGFTVELVASEPMIASRSASSSMTAAGLWVIQYLQYPNPAGLKRVKVDRYLAHDLRSQFPSRRRADRKAPIALPSWTISTSMARLAKRRISSTA